MCVSLVCFLFGCIFFYCKGCANVEEVMGVNGVSFLIIIGYVLVGRGFGVVLKLLGGGSFVLVRSF